MQTRCEYVESRLLHLRHKILIIPTQFGVTSPSGIWEIQNLEVGANGSFILTGPDIAYCCLVIV